jgi:NADH:ubiquinone oxidoreductase subunit 6 (subunit J)
MKFVELLHLILTSVFILSAFRIFFSNHSLYSALHLILCFCISAIILFLFELDFIGFLFILVYVGAVAVLFLFVIMMTDIKRKRKNNISYDGFLFLLFISLMTFIKLFFYINDCFFDDTNSESIIDDLDFTLIYVDFLDDIDIVGQSLFNYYPEYVLLAGLVLLLALIGPISLTIDYKDKEKKDLKQLSKKDNDIFNFFT